MKITNDENYFVSLPSPKRPRLESSSKADDFPLELTFCQYLLVTSEEHRLPGLPSTLNNGSPIRNTVEQWKAMLDRHGFRTSLITSPRPALSVYKDSTTLPMGCSAVGSSSPRDGKTWLVTMMGLHPDQEKLEHLYTTSIKNVYCLMLFCQRLREMCRSALQESTIIADLVSGCELQCRSLGRMKPNDFTASQIIQHAQSLSSSVTRLVASLIRNVVQAEPRHRAEQLEREFARIQVWNSTFSNALMSLFSRKHQCNVKEIVFKQSPQPQYERITIFLHDPQQDTKKPPQFLFLPKLSTLLRDGPEALVEKMVLSFWAHLLRKGYFATQAMKDRLSMDLKAFFLSGITNGPNVPIPLNAQFSPTRPLSWYLHGPAGTGKSSFVRNIQPALEATIDEAVDPEIVARFVKQNLNKRFDVLGLELQLRPNNNDMSVMSIIQQRRMTMTQSKPGLVVIDLEEMPSNDGEADPNQLKVAQLISQRFAGRQGDFPERGTPVPRNSDNRGIAKDASLITLFTSNYDLDEASKEALTRLKMFEHLDAVHMTAVEGSDRIQFANSYLRQCIKDYFAELDPKLDITLDIAFGDGDTRPLVRYLRMIAFYICSLVSRSVRFGFQIEAKVKQKGSRCMVTAGGESIELKGGPLDRLVPVKPRVHDSRVKAILSELFADAVPSMDELSIILDFWFAKTLTPAVVVSNDRSKIQTLIEAVSSLKDVSCIQNVNADSHKMMKSLYDPSNIPNLRDDILRFGRGAYVAVELVCPSKNAQLCIREIIEDSPSMTAFSTAKSALYKEGLLFVVHVTGEITPEILSRASIVI